MKGFGQKFVSTRNLSILLSLVSPSGNSLCINGKWVAGVLSPSYFSCHPKNVKANFIKREEDCPKQIVSRR